MLRIASLIAGVVLVTVACGPREEILPGERLDIRALNTSDAASEAAAEDVTKPAPPALRVSSAQINSSWTHRNGGADHRIRHPELAQVPSRIWSAGIGAGNSRKRQITADPVIADGRVFVMDSQSQVRGFSVDGAPLWTANLVPSIEKAGSNTGGGLAIGGSTVYATTGFGDIVALDTASGAELWRHRAVGPISAAPVVTGNTVVAVTRSNTAVGLDTSNGRIRWEQSSAGGEAGVLGAGSPAATGSLAILPFASGEIVGTLSRNGIRAWSSAVSGGNRGLARSFFGDISSDPVIDGTRIYVANQSGRMAAIDRRSGARIWTVNEGAYTPVWVEGGSIFVITDRFALKRLDADSGAEYWSVELPGYRAKRERRILDVVAHYGPTLAGGQLWVASSDGVMRAYDPQSGDLRATLDLPGGAASQPSIAGGRMFILTGKGQLQVFQ